jgi:xanthine dehydrogenase YagS FAD-binding subunit
MHPFVYARAESANAAIASQKPDTEGKNVPSVLARSQYVAGGTTLIDLMKLDVMRPAFVTDINGLQKDATAGRIEMGPNGLSLGALVRMSEAAENPDVRSNFPIITQSLALAASPQIRNMASLGGNVLQRTRCTYFRDVSYAACNKRAPGSGCAAMEGINRQHAILGTSNNCIATYPGDFAQAMIALDAQVQIAGPNGSRSIPFSELHKAPGDTPHIETTLAQGELITAFVVPKTDWARRSLFLKIRDRESYEFALASAAVALELDNGQIKQARIALGGVSTKPWRSREAEEKLNGQAFSDAAANAAAEAAFAQAKGREHNKFKIELGKRTLMRALHQAVEMEIPS